MASYHSAIEFWSHQRWNNECYRTSTMSQDSCVEGLAEVDCEDADVEMLDLNSQNHDTTSSTSSSISFFNTICANDQQVDTSPSTAAETAPDDSKIMLGAIASMSINAPPQTSAEQNAISAAGQASFELNADTSTISHRNTQCTHEHRARWEGRLVARRPERAASHSVDPAYLPPRLRARRINPTPDVFGPTNASKLSRETSSSQRRQRMKTARARGSQRSRVRTGLWMRPTVDVKWKELQ
jgi:hypothetical protein